MKKPKQKLEQKLQIPEDLQEQLIDCAQKSIQCSSIANLLVMTIDLKDVNKQVANVKKAIDEWKKLLPDNMTPASMRLLIQVLCYIFMDCDAKNPCRRTIASFFQSQNDSEKGQALECLNIAMIDMLTSMTTIQQSIEKTAEELNFRKHVDTICSLLENFPMGEKCVSLRVTEVLRFLVVALERQVVKESLVGTPALQTAAMLDCLVTIKATMNVLQKSKDEIAESLFDDNATTLLLQRFVKVIVDVLKNDTFFPDCRSAAGMAFALVVRTCAEKDALVQTIVSLFFPSYMERPHSTGDKNCAAGWILNSFKQQDISDLSGFSYLSICRGVITMLPRDCLVASSEFLHSVVVEKPGNLLLDVLFPEITSLCLSLKDSSSLVALRTLAYWTTEARECTLDSALDDCFKSRMNDNFEIIQTLLNFVWNFWDHPLEAMRYHTREIFDNAVKIHITSCGNEATSDPFVADLTRKLCEINMFVRGKYGPMCCLVDVLGASAMLAIRPSIPEDIMIVMTDQTVVPHAMEFAEKMFNSHLEQLSKTSSEHLKDWFEVWVVPALRCLSLREKHVRKHISEYYVPTLLKCCPESLHRITEKLNEPENSREGASALDNVRCLVTCLKTARHLGLLPKADIISQEDSDASGLWLGSISLTVLEKALCHLDDEVRSDVLGLICDSVRTTEPLTARDLDLLKEFYPVNMNSQSPSFRQRVLAMTKKLFIRLRDGGRSWKKKLSGGNSDDLNVLAAQIKLYVEFIQWFAKLQFQSLFPGASFARRTTALQNLQLFEQIFPASQEKDPLVLFDSSEIFTSQTVHILLDCFKDTYDINKQMAFDLLAACPASIHPFQETSFTSKWTTTATQYAISPKAINVSTAACMFKILIRKSPHKICLPTRTENWKSTCGQSSVTPVNSKEKFTDPNGEEERNDKVPSLTGQVHQLHLVDEEEETSIPCLQAFRLLSQFITMLKSQIDVARIKLLQAAFEAPIHGVLYCMREIICDLELSDVAGNNKWQCLVSAILQLCYDVTDVVSPVVTNSSPEGNICDNGHTEDDDNDKEFDNFAPKAQILLVCCWRAMKEVSLLLGEITKRAPVKEKDESYGLLTFQQLEEIGELFTNMLLTSKHRGAYELAHEGFVKLCHMLWRCKQREIQRLPEVFLTKLLSDISSDNPTPWLCGTRRSAGLPFFFKAIVTTEPNTTGKCCFKSVMKELLKTAAKPVNSQDTTKDTTLPQVHARNILRALYKETKLGEDVFPYVADGVQVAIDGFLSEIWAVRNSSTLLFSSLMNRIFGPQNFQEEKRRQGMTGREFFSRFPSLHSFLIKQLEISLKDNESDTITYVHLHPSLYPVLLLLSRLHPSAMDGNDSTLNMAAFIPYVLRCSTSCVLKTRAMAARALVPLVSGVNIKQMLKDLIESLPQSSNFRFKQNHVHGCLLQIRELLKRTSTNVALSSKTKEDVYTAIVPLLSARVWLASRVNTCDMSRAVFLSILRCFILDQTWFSSDTDSSDSQIPSNVLNEFYPTIQIAVEEIIQNENLTKGQLFLTGRTLVKEDIARIALHPSPVYGVSAANGLTLRDVSRVIAFLSMPDYEVNLVALEFVHRIFLSTENCPIEKEKMEKIVKVLIKQMWNSEMKRECLAMLYKCLSLVPQSLRFPWQFDGQVVQFNEGWKHVAHSFKTNQRSDVLCSLLQFSSVLVKELHQETPSKDIGNMLEEWVTFIETCAESEESELLRLTLSQVIGSGSITFVLAKPLHAFENLTFRIWKVIVCLLIDDSVEVKVSMATGLCNVMQSVAQDYPRNYSVHSFLALNYAVKTPLELFSSKHPSLTLQWLLDLLDNTQFDVSSETSQDTAYEDMRNIDKLFEKGPANVHREDCTLAEIIYIEFCAWIEKTGQKEMKANLGHLNQLAHFAETRIKNYNGNLPQDSVYYALYVIVVGLSMMKIVIEKVELNDVKNDKEAREIYKRSCHWVQELRKLDGEQCFYHFKLEETTNFVLAES